MLYSGSGKNTHLMALLHNRLYVIDQNRHMCMIKILKATKDVKYLVVLTRREHELCSEMSKNLITRCLSSKRYF